MKKEHGDKAGHKDNGHDHSHKSHYKNIKTKNIPGSKVEIVGAIESSALDEAYKRALKDIITKVELPGFRKGAAPEKMVIDKIGQHSILEEAAEHLLSHEYQHIIIDHKIMVVGRPEVRLTKLAKGNDLEFSIEVAVYPEFKIPDYKKIAKPIASRKEKIELTDDEFKKALGDIKEAMHIEKDKTLTDEDVKKIGKFENVADFEQKIRQNLTEEKSARNREKKRMEIVEAILKEVSFDVPEVFVSGELNKMIGEMKDNILSMGLEIEEYFKKIGKTEQDLRTDWKTDAEKRVRLQMIVNKIAAEEKIQPDKTVVDTRIKEILAQYKNADETRVRDYVETIEVNSKVFEILETTA